jgi:hypothetical protein
MAGKTMELKDMILSTLEELDVEEKVEKPTQETFQKGVKELTKEVEVKQIDLEENVTTSIKTEKDKELTFADPLKEENREFLLNLRERILVLFEGFQAPNNQKIESKIELTLNFFEYLLATIDEKLENSK